MSDEEVKRKIKGLLRESLRRSAAELSIAIDDLVESAVDSNCDESMDHAFDKADSLFKNLKVKVLQNRMCAKVMDGEATKKDLFLDEHPKKRGGVTGKRKFHNWTREEDNELIFYVKRVLGHEWIERNKSYPALLENFSNGRPYKSNYNRLKHLVANGEIPRPNTDIGPCYCIAHRPRKKARTRGYGLSDPEI